MPTASSRSGAVAREPGYRAKIAVESKDGRASTRSARASAREAPASAWAESSSFGARRSTSSRGTTSPPGSSPRPSRRPRWREVVRRRRAPPVSTVVVPDGELSLAIGKEGLNARLAAPAHRLAHRHRLRDGVLRRGGRAHLIPASPAITRSPMTISGSPPPPQRRREGRRGPSQSRPRPAPDGLHPVAGAGCRRGDRHAGRGRPGGGRRPGRAAHRQSRGTRTGGAHPQIRRRRSRRRRRRGPVLGPPGEPHAARLRELAPQAETALRTYTARFSLRGRRVGGARHDRDSADRGTGGDRCHPPALGPA